MKRITLFIVGIILSLALYSQNKTIDWDTDLNYLEKELPEKHCDLFAIKSKDTFITGINAIKEESSSLKDVEIALKIQQLIAKFGDSHTNLNINQILDKNQILPMHLLWASDGLYILHTTHENKEILGSRISSINSTPIATIIDSLSTLFAIDNEAMIKTLTPQTISSMQILEYFGFAKTAEAKVQLGLKTRSNQDQTYTLKPFPMNRNNRISFKPDSLSFDIINENILFTDHYFPDEQIYYIMYNQCLSKEVVLKYGNKEKAKKLPSFKEFENKAIKTLENESIKKIIFDMRYNGGGNSSQGTAFIEKLAQFLKTAPQTKIYVVLGRKTFSSAILNAMDFKRLTNAVFVGEGTAGKPNHYGEVRNLQLPTSKLQVNYSTRYFRTTDEDINTIAPDVKIEMSFSDFTKGIDPIFEWIKQQ